MFTDFSHIVAIRTSGNVYVVLGPRPSPRQESIFNSLICGSIRYSYDAVEELNIKRKHWKDLLDDTPFKREDIVTIQVRGCDYCSPYIPGYLFLPLSLRYSLSLCRYL